MKERMQRLDKYIRYKGLSDYRITKACGISQGLLSKARKGETDLGSETVLKIVKFYTDLNFMWVMTGEGEMLDPPPCPPPGVSIRNGNVNVRNGSMMGNVSNVGGTINGGTGTGDVSRYLAIIEAMSRQLAESQRQVTMLLGELARERARQA